MVPRGIAEHDRSEMPFSRAKGRSHSEVRTALAIAVSYSESRRHPLPVVATCDMWLMA